MSLDKVETEMDKFMGEIPSSSVAKEASSIL
jgi:hypothetical protein